MNATVKSEPFEVQVDADTRISARACTPEWWPSGDRIGIALAHDAESSMEDANIAELQQALARRGHLALAFNFPYAQAGRKRPDPLPVLERTFRAALGALLRDAETAPGRLILAGYGLGARVACQIVAQGVKVEGVACMGFPLHPSGKPNQYKAEALYRIICPMLFIQGARDVHCRLDRLSALLRTIGAPTQLRVIEDCGAGLSLIRKTERTPEEVRAETLQSLEGFIRRVI
jgi:predicted alpha/beta-hydrolase family hydrolase